MELHLFFDAIPEEILQYKCTQSLFINSDGKIPENWNHFDIALIGIEDNRGTDNTGASEAAHQIRKQLYALYKSQVAYRILDLGNLRNGLSLEDTRSRLREVCKILLKERIIPIIIGGSHDFTESQYLAYEDNDELISMINVDALLDLNMHADKNNKKHLYQILSHKPNYLFSFHNLGHQVYYNPTEAFDILEKMYYNSYGAGQLRKDINEAEPLIRNAHLLSFDITAIKMDHAPGNTYATPFGLSGEEACKLAWYAGLSNTISSIGFYEYNPELDVRDRTAQLISIMIWYFIEGYYHRITDLDFQSDRFIKYAIPLSPSSVTQEITFYKHKISNLWWLEVPYPKESASQEKIFRVACSYRDYQQACEGIVPDKWIQTYNKLL